MMNKLIVRLGNNVCIFRGDNLTYEIIEEEDNLLKVKFDSVEAVRFIDWTSLEWIVIISGTVTPTIINKDSGGDIEKIINGGFEEEDTGWIMSDASVTTSEYHSGEKSCNIIAGGQIVQDLSGEGIVVSNITSLKTYAKGEIGVWVIFYVYYVGAGSEVCEVQLATTDWEEVEVLSHLTQTDKIIDFIMISADTDPIYVDDISLKVGS
jgi:hypothetical protein